MATHVLPRRLLALGTCAALGVFATAALAGTASAKAKPKPKKKHHTTTTTSKKGKSTGKTTSKALTAEIKQLETKAKGEKQATFIATYKSTGGTSKTQTITEAQEPPKSLFKTGTGEFIDNGSTSFECSNITKPATTTTTGATGSTTTPGTTSGPTCIKTTEAGPLASMFDLFSTTTALTFFDSAEAEAAAKAAGVTLSFSTGTYAGLKSKCVTGTKGGSVYGKYCVADIGLVDYIGTTKGEDFELIKYSTSVPAGTFTPPKGATITTLPAGA